MLEKVYLQKSTIESLRNGSLGDYPDELAQYYFDNGYVGKNLKSRFGPLSQFNTLLIDNNKTLQDLAYKTINSFVDLQIETKKSFVCSGAGLLFKHLISLLIRDGVITPLASKPVFGSAGINTLLSEYKQYLSREKGLAPTSIKRSSNLAQNVIVYLNASTMPKIGGIKAEDIHSYMISRGWVMSQ